MGDRDQRLLDAHFFGASGRAAMEPQAWRSAVAHDFNVFPRDAARLAGSERFHRGFFHGKPAGEMWDGVAALCTISNLAVGEDAAQKSIAISFEDVSDAREVCRVDAYSNDVHPRASA